ncbi:MAG: aldose 1-epimerase [Spirochaetales bacterium]|nr:aldose 1-epimerase [Spirochaetales bacterium]
MSDERLITLRHPAGATALIDARCGGTVHRLSLVPSRDDASPSDGRDPSSAEAILKGDEPIAADGEAACDPGLFRGRVLAPFNDRIADGVYRWRGRQFRLPGNDPDTSDAIHGFLYRRTLRRSAISVISNGASETTLELCGALPGEEESGYPFLLAASVVYTLRASEFVLTVRLTNLGEEEAPISVGWHPYFRLAAAGCEPDEYRVTVPAERFVEVDAHLLPTGRTPPVAGTPFDFRSPTMVGGRVLDIAFPLAGDRPTVSVAGGERIVHMTMEGAFRMAQMFVPADRDSVAIEPVSAPANVFNRPELGVIALAAGESVAGTALLRYARRR